MNSGPRILLTGASGFIGSHLARRLLEEGFELTGTYRNHDELYRLEPIRDRMHLVRLDLRDAEGVERVLRERRVEGIIHCAARGVRAEESPGWRVVEENVKMSAILGTLAVKHRIRKFVYVGSGFEYAASSCPVTEETPLEPVNLYGAAKAAGWLVLDCLRRTENLPLVTVRLFSVFGPAEDPGKLVPQLVISALRREPVALTTGEQIRDYVFVEDAVEAIAQATVRAAPGKVYNLGGGPEHAVSVRDIAELTAKLCGAPRELLRYGVSRRARPEPPLLVADPTRARGELGWRPRVPLEEGLRRTIDWYRLHAVSREASS